MGDWIGAAINAGAGLLGSLFGPSEEEERERMLKDLDASSAVNFKWNEMSAESAQERWKENTDYVNQYNTPAEQVKRLEAAGLNPALMYGAGAGTTGTSNASTTGQQGAGGGNGRTANLMNAADRQMMAMNKQSMAMNAMKIAAEVGLINAQKEKTEAEVPKVGEEIENVKADTALTKAQKLLAEANIDATNALAGLRTAQEGTENALREGRYAEAWAQVDKVGEEIEYIQKQAESVDIHNDYERERMEKVLINLESERVLMAAQAALAMQGVLLTPEQRDQIGQAMVDKAESEARSKAAEARNKERDATPGAYWSRFGMEMFNGLASGVSTIVATIMGAKTGAAGMRNNAERVSIDKQKLENEMERWKTGNHESTSYYDENGQMRGYQSKHTRSNK